MDEVTIHGLTVGPATVDLVLRRLGDGVAVQVARRQGDVAVVTVG